jgi:hypothetical protein
MELITQEQREQLLKNGKESEATKPDCPDYYPVVKLFTPWSAATWLITELDPEEPDIAFGLCDLGFGFPELGCVRISELAADRDCFGMEVERELHWKAKKTLSEYAEDARKAQRIVA